MLTALSLPVFALALLAVLRAPNEFFWQPAILATEYGHRLWPVPLALAVVAGPGFLLALNVGAAIFFLTPWLRARHLAGRYPKRMRDFAPGNGERPSRFPAAAPRTLCFRSPAGDELTYDFYPAADARGPCPVAIVVHGGSWQGGQRSELPELHRHLAARGFHVVAASYRFAPTHRWPAARDDLTALLAELQSRRGALALDLDRYFLVGRSAGGHLALSLAYSTTPAPRGVIAFYPSTDLVYGYDVASPREVLDTRKLIADLMGGPPSALVVAYRDASPIEHVTERSPPTLLIHGTRDELVTVDHSRRLYRRLREHGVRTAFLELPWATHAFDYSLRGPGGRLAMRAVDDFLTALR